MKTNLLLPLSMLWLSFAMASQQRDTPAAAAQPGTGEISGVVVSEDLPPRPLRRAIVTLGGDISAARSVVTDDEGRFRFEGLPAGRFTLTSRKPAYLPGAYGASRPSLGTAISLARDGRITVTLTMARGAVVTGIVTDRNGQPLPGISVGALDVRTVTANTMTTAEFVITDDRGMYRIYGLTPGDYVVAAIPRTTGSGETGAPSAAHIDAVFAELSRRDGRTVAAPGRSRPQYQPVPPAPPVGFAPTYFPGTPVFREAGRVTLARGDERVGLDFAVSPVRVATISGVVSGGVQHLAATQLSLIIDGPRLPSQMGTAPVLTRRPDDQGRFMFSNMAPGRYRITARANRTQTEPAAPGSVAGGGGGGGSSTGSSGGAQGPAGLPAVAPGAFGGAQAGDFVFAVADVDVFGEDISGVALALQPGSVFTGRILVDASGSAPAPDLTKLQVSVSPPGGTSYSMSNGTMIGNSFSAVRPVPVKDDGTFAIANIGPGSYSLRCVLPSELDRVWRLASAVVDGRDLLDSPLAFEPSVNFSGVALTLTDKHSELSGSLHSDAGAVAPHSFVVVFPADRTLWREGSRRMQSARPASDGRFSIADLPGGEYFLASLPDVEETEWQKPPLLEGLAAMGVKVIVRDGEKTTQDLRITR